MSVQTTSCPASARHAPVTRPTYPQPMTERRKTNPPFDELRRTGPYAKRDLNRLLWPIVNDSIKGTKVSVKVVAISAWLPIVLVWIRKRRQDLASLRFSHQQATQSEKHEARLAAHHVPQ